VDPDVICRSDLVVLEYAVVDCCCYILMSCLIQAYLFLVPVYNSCCIGNHRHCACADGLYFVFGAEVWFENLI